MGNSGCAVLRWYRYIPDAEAVLRHGVGIGVPVVCESQSSSLNMARTQRTEFADQRSLRCVWCPFLVFDFPVGLCM